MPEGYSSSVSGMNRNSFSFSEVVAPDAVVKANFVVSSPKTTGAGYVTAKAEWKNTEDNKMRSEAVTARIRNVNPVTINEIRLSTSTNPRNQFIELYNSSVSEINISGWSLMNTRSEWAPVKLAPYLPVQSYLPKAFTCLDLQAQDWRLRQPGEAPSLMYMR
jgi:hypothetical protein